MIIERLIRRKALLDACAPVGLAGKSLAQQKFFAPLFYKKRAGSRGCAPGRAPQRAEAPCAKEAQEGIPPLRAARLPQKSNENAAHSGGVFTISRVVIRTP